MHPEPTRKYRPSVEISCPNCGKRFRAYQCELDRGRTNHCSTECAMEMRRKRAQGRLHERFWRFVSQTDGCWFWTGSTNPHGYGQIMSPPPKRNLLAHRVSWEIHHGAITGGLHVCHTCDNPRCVNPAHLFLGTRSDNMRDMSRKGRNRNWTRKPFAEREPEIAAEIRRRYSVGGVTRQQLADEFGVSFGIVGHLVRMKSG